MSSGVNALAGAVTAALVADAAIAALVRGVHADTPDWANTPFVAIGPHSASDWSWAGGRGERHRLTLFVWDDAGDGARVAAAIDLVERCVTTMPRALDGWRLVTMRATRNVIERQPDGWTRGAVELAALIEEI